MAQKKLHAISGMGFDDLERKIYEGLFQNLPIRLIK